MGLASKRATTIPSIVGQAPMLVRTLTVDGMGLVQLAVTRQPVPGQALGEEAFSEVGLRADQALTNLGSLALFYSWVLCAVYGERPGCRSPANGCWMGVLSSRQR
jgi:hypothetical protein